jgi:hypothetical protein
MTPKPPNRLKTHLLVQLIVLAVMIFSVGPAVFFVPALPPLTVAPKALLLTGWAVCPSGSDARVIRNPVFRGGYSFDMECTDQQGNVVLLAEEWPFLAYVAITGTACCVLAYLPLAALGLVVAAGMTRKKAG